MRQLLVDHVRFLSPPNDLKKKVSDEYLAFVFSMTPIFYATCLFAPLVEHVRSPGVKLLLLRVVPPVPSKMILLLAWAQSHHKTISSSEEETY